MDIYSYSIESAALAPDPAAGALRHGPSLGYRCGTCGAAFATRSQRDVHLERTFHGVQCLVCGVVHATRGLFSDHTRGAHGRGIDVGNDG